MDKLLALILFSVIFIYTFSVNAQTPIACNKHLQINSATEQKWNPGIVQDNNEPAGGMVYEIKIKVKKSGYILFQNLIIDNQVLPLEVVKDAKRSAVGPFSKDDVLSLIARTNRKKNYSAPDEAIVRIVNGKNAKAAIVYTLDEKHHVHTIPKFDAKEGAPIN
jgi:hypothetical protein